MLCYTFSRLSKIKTALSKSSRRVDAENAATATETLVPGTEEAALKTGLA